MISSIPSVTEAFVKGKIDSCGSKTYYGHCANGCSNDNRGTFHSCNNTLYSYHYEIAHRTFEGSEFYIELQYQKGNRNNSQTTNRHLRGFERTMDTLENCQWFSSYGTYGGWRINY